MKKTPIETINQLNEFYDAGHTLSECCTEFSLEIRTVRRYVKNIRKQPKLDDAERRRRRVQNVISWRKRVKKRLIDYKGGKCQCCGYNACDEAMEFHHVDPTIKDFQISGSTRSFESLKVEVDKTILVCANCHREIHSDLRDPITFIGRKAN